MEWMIKPYARYFDFNGRSRRLELWAWTGFTVVVAGVLSCIAVYGFQTSPFYSPAYWLFYLLNLIPSLTAGVRRLHDTGRSGFWILICLLPLAGIVWLIVLYLLPSERGPNRFGDDPTRGAPRRSAAHPSADDRTIALEQLARLADLRDRGALSEVEFAREKVRLLGSSSDSSPPISGSDSGAPAAATSVVGRTPTSPVTSEALIVPPSRLRRGGADGAALPIIAVLVTVLIGAGGFWYVSSRAAGAAGAAALTTLSSAAAPDAAALVSQAGRPISSWSEFLASGDPHFARLATPVYRGRSKRPDFTGRQAAFSDYRTRLNDGFKEAPNFAGDHGFVMFGCGTECVTGYVINHRDANIIKIPFADEEHLSSYLSTQPDSRYLKAVWKEGDEHPICIGQAFIFLNERFFAYGPRLQQEPDEQSDCPEFVK